MNVYIAAETLGALVNSIDPLTALSSSHIPLGSILGGLATLQTPSNTCLD